MRRILAFAVLLAGVVIPGRAANFSGKWTLQGGPGRAAGRGGAVLNLNQVGNEVTGTISVRIDMGTNSPVNAEVWGGKVEGDTLSFYVWTGQDQPVKVAYRGTLSVSGDEIVFTVTRGGGAPGQAPAQKTIARRSR